MKASYILVVLSSFLIASCASVNVRTDYDSKANFNQYSSFAFFKPGIDKVEISDLDKKRILRAIDKTMQEKGFVKSTTPDVLVSIVTKAEKNVNVYQNNVGFGYGWGWYNPFWFGGGFNNFGTFETVEGRLFIDIIDANKKELIWQGVGTAALVEGPEAKDERIQEIVSAILAKYPPQKK